MRNNDSSPKVPNSAVFITNAAVGRAVAVILFCKCTWRVIARHSVLLLLRSEGECWQSLCSVRCSANALHLLISFHRPPHKRVCSLCTGMGARILAVFVQRAFIRAYRLVLPLRRAHIHRVRARCTLPGEAQTHVSICVLCSLLSVLMHE